MIKDSINSGTENRKAQMEVQNKEIAETLRHIKKMIKPI
jgi:hypothetical protein